MSGEIIQFSAALKEKRLQEEMRLEKEIRAMVSRGVNPARQTKVWNQYLAAKKAKKAAKLLEAKPAPETLTETVHQPSTTARTARCVAGC
jgi:hypothetical protein